MHLGTMVSENIDGDPRNEKSMRLEGVVTLQLTGQIKDKTN